MKSVYLDHAATTPVDPRVLEEMSRCYRDVYGNPSSVHREGRKAKFLVEECRERAAEILGATAGEIVFTSGGTESDNTALRCGYKSSRPGIITSPSEHEAILKCASASNRPVTLAPLRDSGQVDISALAKEDIDSACIASFMLVNNEIGSVNRVRELSEWAHAAGLVIHSDAVQGFSTMEIDVRSLGVDLLTLSGHKINGPKGVGLLFVDSGIDFNPLLIGGSQEQKRRAGTENVAGIAGFVKAMELVTDSRQDRIQHYKQLKEHFLRTIEKEFEAESYIVNSPSHGAPHIVNVSFPPVGGSPLDGEMLMLNLDHAGFCVSSGSACSSGSMNPSHVLLAIGRQPEEAKAAVRVSFGVDTTKQDLDSFIMTLSRTLARMRSGALIA